MKKILTSINGYSLNKCNTIFVNDEDGHHYAIHEDDIDAFDKALELCINSNYDDESMAEFYDLFGENQIGTDPLLWRQENLN